MNKKRCLNCGFMAKDYQQHVFSLSEKDRNAILDKNFHTIRGCSLFCEMGEWNERINGNFTIRKDHKKLLKKKCKNFIPFAAQGKTFAAYRNDLQIKKERRSVNLTVIGILVSLVSVVITLGSLGSSTSP